jgi:hypothetical protein
MTARGTINGISFGKEIAAHHRNKDCERGSQQAKTDDDRFPPMIKAHIETTDVNANPLIDKRLPAGKSLADNTAGPFVMIVRLEQKRAGAGNQGA